MKRLTCILTVIMLILQVCTFAVGAGVPESPNLIVNGDFSDGTNGWFLRDSASDATFEIAEGMGEDGSDCLYVSKSDRNGDVTQAIPSLINAKAGETYLISAKIRLATEGATTTARWGYTEGGGYWLGNPAGYHDEFDDTAAITDKWTTVSVVFSLKNDYLYVPNYFLVASSSGDKGGYYLDDVILQRVDTENFIANPNFDYGVAGWKPANAAKTITAYKDGDEACVKVTSGNGDRSDLQQVSGAALKSSSVGDTYVVTAKVKVASTNSTSTTARLCLGGWSWLGTQNVPVTTNEWTLLSATYEVTDSTNIANALGLWVALYDNADATTEFLVDDVAVLKIEDKTLNPNFDYGVAGWKPANAAKAITAYKDGDEACVKVTSGNGDRSDLQQVSGAALKSAKVGDTYCVSAKVKVASTNATSTAARLCLGGWSWLGTQNVPVTTNEWTQLIATYEVTDSTNIASAQGLWVVLYDNADATTEFLVDDVYVFKMDNTKPPYEVYYEGSATKIGTLKANIDFYNSLSTSMDSPLAMLVLYDGNGKLVDIEMKDIVPTKEYCASRTTLSMNISKNDQNATAKVLIWDSLNGVMPFTELKEKPTYTIAFVGGSLTEYGATWIKAVKEYFEELYPDKHILTVHSGIGGTGSDVCAPRYNKDILSASPDLVFIDTTVNDTKYDETKSKVFIESMVRQSLEADKVPNIIFLHTPHGVDKTNEEFYLNWVNVKNWKNEIADYYGLGSIDIYDYMYKDYEANKEINGWTSYMDYLGDNGYSTWVIEGEQYDVHAGYLKYGEAIIDALDKNFSALVKQPADKQTKYVDDARVDWKYRFSYPDSMTYDNNWILYKTAYTNNANSSHNISSGLLLKHPGGILQTTTKDATVTYTTSKDALGFNIYYISSTQGATVSVAVDGEQKEAAVCTYNAASGGYNNSGWISLPNDGEEHTITITTSGINETNTIFRMGCIVECY